MGLFKDIESGDYDCLNPKCDKMTVVAKTLCEDCKERVKAHHMAKANEILDAQLSGMWDAEDKAPS